MLFYTLADLDIHNITNQNYDLAIFSSGYEARCTFVPRLINKQFIKNSIIMGFIEQESNVQRKINNDYYITRWNDQIEKVSSKDEKIIYEKMHNQIITGSRKIHILIDYTSMSRVWYAAILNYFKFTNYWDEAIIDFTYSVGEHSIPLPDFLIEDIIYIPGCEGVGFTIAKSAAIFGLGFEGYSPLAVCDQLEPDYVYAFLADPAAFPSYPSIAYDANKEFIDEHVYQKKVIKFSLFSVEQTFRGLTEIVSPHLPDSRITIIPMGPKPHILASILLSHKFPEIGCFHVSGRKKDPENVQPLGDIVATRVIFKISPN